MEGVVWFNVGGTRFATTMTTLKAQGENMLSQLVSSERVGVVRDSKGCVFIDRNPALFAHVLDYLRTGELSLQANQAALLKELRFFAVKGVLDAGVSDVTLREMLTFAEDDVSLLRSFPEETQLVVRSVMEHFHECAERGERPVQSPVFVHSVCPEWYGSQEMNPMERGHCVDSRERNVKWPVLISELQKWSTLPIPRDFSAANYAWLQQAVEEVACHKPLCFVDNVREPSLQPWVAALAKHFKSQYHLTVTPSFRKGKPGGRTTRHVSSFYFSWKG